MGYSRFQIPSINRIQKCLDIQVVTTLWIKLHSLPGYKQIRRFWTIQVTQQAPQPVKRLPQIVPPIPCRFLRPKERYQQITRQRLPTLQGYINQQSLVIRGAKMGNWLLIERYLKGI